MKRLGLFLAMCLAFWSHAQPLFVPNLGQWAEPFLAKTPLSYGAVFWEPSGFRMMLLNERVMPEHGHHDEARSGVEGSQRAQHVYAYRYLDRSGARHLAQAAVFHAFGRLPHCDLHQHPLQPTGQR